MVAKVVESRGTVCVTEGRLTCANGMDHVAPGSPMEFAQQHPRDRARRSRHMGPERRSQSRQAKLFVTELTKQAGASEKPKDTVQCPGMRAGFGGQVTAMHRA